MNKIQNKWRRRAARSINYYGRAWRGDGTELRLSVFVVTCSIAGHTHVLKVARSLDNALRFAAGQSQEPALINEANWEYIGHAWWHNGYSRDWEIVKQTLFTVHPGAAALVILPGLFSVTAGILTALGVI